MTEQVPAEVLDALKECADELAEWVQERYRVTLHHPSEKRRFDRDMEPVMRARAVLLRYRLDTAILS
jgi:hypothetical protein